MITKDSFRLISQTLELDQDRKRQLQMEKHPALKFALASDLPDGNIHTLFKGAAKIGHNNGVVVQPKLDGLRAMWIAKRKTFLTRGGHFYRPHILAHIDMSWAKEDFDGELYAHGYMRPVIAGAASIHLNEPKELTQFIRFHIFDMPTSGSLSAYWRMSRLSQLTHEVKARNVNFVPTYWASTQSTVEKLHQWFISQGYEGTIVRRFDSLYEPGRSHTVWRIKPFGTDMFECIGISRAALTFENRVGALLFATTSGEEFKVGTGFTMEQSREWFTNPPIGKWAVINFRLLNNNIPNNASFVKFI
jgi:DNA ligase-1